MTQLDKQVRSAQHRLWINRWFLGLSWSLTTGLSVLGVLILVQRGFELNLPLTPLAAALLGLSLLGSGIWTFSRREGPAVAAAMLDDAAGLRERLSTAHFCVASWPDHPDGLSTHGGRSVIDPTSDPFARAVVDDAEGVSRTLSAREHIRLQFPAAFGWTTLTALVSAAMFLVPVGLLTSTEAAEEREETVELKQAHVAVKHQMDRVEKLMQDTPALADLKDKLSSEDEDAAGRLHRPGDVRHEAIKKIDSLADAVKQKRESGRYEAVREMRKMLRGLKTPKSEGAETQKLSKALSKGDFQTAQEEIKALKEQLATLKSDQDKEMAAKMSKQLEELSKQLAELAKNEKLVKKLTAAGLKKEDVQRMLENLKKEDLEQVKKALEKKGLTQSQINKLAQELKQGQQAKGIASKMAQGMKKAAQGAQMGQMGNAMEGLSMAGDQLSQLEQLEQEMNQLDGALSELQASAGQISNPCPNCKGAG